MSTKSKLKLTLTPRKPLNCECFAFQQNPVVERTEVEDKLGRTRGCFQCVHCTRFLQWTRSKSTLNKIAARNVEVDQWLARAQALGFSKGEISCLHRMRDNANPSPYTLQRFEIIKLKAQSALSEKIIDAYEEAYGELDL